MILLSLGIFQYFVKIKSEEDTWKWENIFLKRLGMHEKDRKAKIRYQLKFFVTVPMSFGILGGIIFAGLTAKARLFTRLETLQFAGCMAMVCLIWILAWILVYLTMKWNIWRYVEKE